MPVRIDVYGKPGCTLCAEALDLLDEVRADFACTVEEHNILEDEGLFARYRYRVPVVVIEGIERLELQFDKKDLETALAVSQVPRRE